MKNNFNDVSEIRYRNARKVPVQLEYDSSNSTLYITAHVRFSKSLLKGYTNLISEKLKEMIGEPEPEKKTFADVAQAGIIEKWSGAYDMTPWGGPENLTVKVNILRKDKGEIPEGQRYFKIQRVYGKGTSFVTSPVWRWLWGFIRGGRECFFTLNWSPNYPGTISMNKYSSKGWFKSTISHEFGHILGLGDAYDAFYRFYYEAPGTGSYMMNYNKRVAPEEIMMAMRAHFYKKMQYFPCVFNFKRVVNGIKSSIFNNR